MKIDFNDKMVFVCAPYSSNDQFIKESRFKSACIGCGLIMDLGGFPMSPLVHGVPIANEMKLPDDFDYWSKYCLSFINKSDFLVVLNVEGWEDSSGIKAEIELAHKLNKPVYLFKIVDLSQLTLIMYNFMFVKEL